MPGISIVESAVGNTRLSEMITNAIANVADDKQIIRNSINQEQGDEQQIKP